jgi:hypothetical protein
MSVIAAIYGAVSREVVCEQKVEGILEAGK